MGLVHEQDGAVAVRNGRDGGHIGGHAVVVRARQDDGPQVGIAAEGFFHLVRRELSLQVRPVQDGRCGKNRNRRRQNQAARHTAVGIAGHEDLVPGPQGHHQHGMDRAGGAVDSQKGRVAAVQFRCRRLRRGEASPRIMDIV